jgi:hypothetical protein
MGTAKQNRRTLQTLAFTISTSGEGLLSLVAYFNVPSRRKPIAALFRGGQFHPVPAMSGWAHSEEGHINIQVAGRK